MVLGGPAPFNAAVEHLASIPHEIMLPLEICFILVPFLFHGLYGLYILMQAKNNVKKLWLCSQLEFLSPKNNCCYYLPFLNLACCLSPHYGKRWRYSYFLRIITSLFPKSACMGCLYNRYDCIYFSTSLTVFTTFTMTWGYCKRSSYPDFLLSCIHGNLCSIIPFNNCFHEHVLVLIYKF